MEKDPLLPYSTSPSPTRLRNFQSLFSLPEDDEISVSLPLTPTELKNQLIFGPKDQNFTNSLSNTPPSFESFVNSNPYIDSPHNLTQSQNQIQHNNNNNNNNSSSSSSSSSAWLLDPNFQWIHKTSLHRAKTAPAMAVINDLKKNTRNDPSNPKPNFATSQSIIRQAFVLLVLYLSFGVVIYWFNRKDFLASETHPVVDALYFCIVTMCTIGYGDITPNTTATKLFSILFVLVGFGFIDILLTGMVSYVLDLQESYLLRAVKGDDGGEQKKKDSPGFFLIDVKKGRMRIRMKVALALGVVVLCIGIGAMVMHYVEQLGWMDSLYLSVMSVTTVGYGDRAFRSLPGRIFASIWLLVSTLAVARAFLYLAEARVDKRQRRMVKWVLGQDMTVAEFLAADIDNNGFVSKSEYVIYKLKEMGKVSDKDIMQICQKFDRLDTGNCGKITLVDLMESHQT